MKLHIKKDWIQKFDHKEEEVEYGAGTALGKKSILAAIQDSVCSLDWQHFPLLEMAKLGWIDSNPEKLRSRQAEILNDFFISLGSKLPAEALCRSTFHENSSEVMDKNALIAWSVRILQKAKKEQIETNFDSSKLTEDFLKSLAKLSKLEKGPLKAKKELAMLGIVLVIERHLPKTYLDGAAILSEDGIPVIGLTIRYDRVDNFWFTLLHEVVHVWKHLTTSDELFVDNFDPNDEEYKFERCEIEANKYARDALIPRSIWRRSDAYTSHTPADVIELANELHIHPAIVAGRIQFENNKYQILRDIVDRDSVRRFFSDVVWD